MKKTLSILALGATLALSSDLKAQIVYSENFESTTGTALPTGWTQNVTPNDSVGYRTGTNATLGSTYFNMNAHTRFVGVNDDARRFAANNNIFLMSPSFSLASASAPYLSFDACFLRGSSSTTAEEATVEVSTDGGTTWTVVSTLAANASLWWEPRYINLSAYGGMSNVKLGFRYKDDNDWMYGFCIDDVTVFTPPTNDLKMVSIAPMTGSGAAYAIGGGSITMSGVVQNMGSSTVTSYNVNYSFNSGATVSSPVSASIAPFSTATFTHSTPITMPTTIGDYPVRMWVSLTGDANAANDSSVRDTLTSVSFMPVKKIVYEEGTGTWCGWCVRGIVYMDSLKALHPDRVSLIAVHNGDPMVVTAYDTWMGGEISGYPSVVIDRTTTGDPSSIINYYNQHNNDFGFAEITGTASHTSTSVSIAATVKPAINLTGDYRLVLVLTEDDVRGTAAGYNQANYYSGSTTNLLSGGGVNYNTQPNPILAANMNYDHTARSITPSVTGSAGVLPASMTAGTTYTATLTATLASTWNKNNMHAVVMLINNATGRVLNSQNMAVAVGVENVNSILEGVSVYPNPASDIVNVQFALLSNSKVTVDVLDMTGRVVSSANTAEYNAGTVNIGLSTADLAAGIYNVKITTDAGSTTQRLSIVK